MPKRLPDRQFEEIPHVCDADDRRSSASIEHHSTLKHLLKQGCQNRLFWCDGARDCSDQSETID
jgi:hypothetical protein